MTTSYLFICVFVLLLYWTARTTIMYCNVDPEEGRKLEKKEVRDLWKEQTNIITTPITHSHL